MKTKYSILIMASVRWYNASAHYAFVLAQSLKDNGHNVCILGEQGSPIIAKAKQHSIKTIEINVSGVLSSIRNIFYFRKLVKQNNLDIVHPHFSKDHTFAYIALAGMRKNIIRTRCDSSAPKNNIFNRFFYQHCARYYAAPSSVIASHLEKLGVDKTRIAVIPQSLDYKAFTNYKPSRDLRRELNIPKNKIVVSFIGRLHKIKGLEYFVRSYEYLKNKKRYFFIVSGEEIDVTISSLRQLAGNIGLEDICVIGREYDAREILAVTDIGVVPSLGSEAVCRIALEMFAYNIPVAGTRVNSIPEIISEYAGVVVEPGSPREIAAAIEKITRDYKAMQKRIGVKIKQNPHDKFLMEYIDLYSKVL